MVGLSNIHIKSQIVNGETHQFLLLLHHKLVEGQFTYFTSYQECLLSLNENKYSILEYFDDSFKIDGKFTFMIEYPDCNCFVFFQQEKNPLNTPNNADVGHLFVNNTCKGNIEFKGLTLNNYGAFLDGCNDEEKPNDWFYAIGQRNPWAYHQLAGFIYAYTPKIMEVNFYVKLKNLSLLERFVKKSTCRGNVYHRPFLLY